MTKKQTKRKKKAVKKKTAKRSNRKTNRKSKRKRPPPLTQAECQRLGYAYRDLAEADLNSGIKPNLSRVLERHPRLRAKFQKGHLLQSLTRLAPTADSFKQAVVKLKQMGFDFEKAQDLRDLFDRDIEAADAWRKAEANAWIDNRQLLIAAAVGGNVKAIQLIDAWFIDRDREAQGPPVKLSRMKQTDIAALFAVTRITVRQWTDANRCPRNADASYNLADVIRWRLDFEKRKAAGSGKLAPADELRDLKAADKRLDIEERRANLLDRGEVISGLVARWQTIVGACRYKSRELATQVHGQTVANTEAIFERSFEDLQRQWLDVPTDFLRLPEQAEAKFVEMLESLKPATIEDKNEGREEDTKKQIDQR